MGTCDFIADQRSIRGEYALERGPRWFKLVRRDGLIIGQQHPEVFEVERLGWSDDVIIARGRGPGGGGWFVLDVRSHEVTGPIADTDWASRRESERLKAIKDWDIRTAWAKAGT